jgi:uncharacterized ferritin-like protein (DUF455 family)
VTSDNLFARAAACLAEPEPDRKLEMTREAAADWTSGALTLDPGVAPPVVEVPGRPPRPLLVAPRELERRRLSNAKGQAALIHAVTHIEFNAINLAWDAVQRFRAMPWEFYSDWVGVAADEAHHFALMRGRLNELGYDYGDFPAHDGLWEMARRTAHDPLTRMALVPRVLEARGLDVTPGMIERLRAAGDEATAGCLEIILREEVGHVAAGSRWMKYLCAERGLDAESVFFELLGQYMKGEIRCPLNLEDRRLAGFEPAELQRLVGLCGERTESVDAA